MWQNRNILSNSRRMRVIEKAMSKGFATTACVYMLYLGISSIGQEQASPAHGQKNNTCNLFDNTPVHFAFKISLQIHQRMSEFRIFFLKERGVYLFKAR